MNEVDFARLTDALERRCVTTARLLGGGELRRSRCWDMTWWVAGLTDRERVMLGAELTRRHEGCRCGRGHRVDIRDADPGIDVGWLEYVDGDLAVRGFLSG